MCCSIFRLEGEHVTPASQILRAWHSIAEVDWAERYGWVPVHWETMIGPDTMPGRDAHTGPLGACFRRAGYRPLGMTTGRSARRPAGSTHGPRVWSDSEPKLVLYRGPLPRIPLEITP